MLRQLFPSAPTWDGAPQRFPSAPIWYGVPSRDEGNVTLALQSQAPTHTPYGSSHFHGVGKNHTLLQQNLSKVGTSEDIESPKKTLELMEHSRSNKPLASGVFGHKEQGKKYYSLLSSSASSSSKLKALLTPAFLSLSIFTIPTSPSDPFVRD